MFWAFLFMKNTVNLHRVFPCTPIYAALHLTL